MTTTPMDSLPYRHVRALTRGLDLLRELNTRGHARAAELAAATGIDRTTTYRLLATLAEYGLVQPHPSSDDYVLTAMVRRLSDGYTERDHLTQIVTPHLGALFQQVLWPTDFAIFEAGAMVIRETTHRFSPYSVHRAIVGQPRQMLTTALGRAALAGASPADRLAMMEIARGTDPDPAPQEWIDAQIDQAVADYARRGYSCSAGLTDGRVSAIGLAVCTEAHIGAAINLVFFRSAMTIEIAAHRFLDPMRACVAAIEARLARAPE